MPYIPYIPFRPSTAHGLHSFCIQARQTISAMLSIASTLYIAASHNIIHSTCTHSATHCTTFHKPLHTTNKHTKYICVSGGKMAQDVGMVWSVVVSFPSMYFHWFFSVPSLHVTSAQTSTRDSAPKTDNDMQCYRQCVGKAQLIDFYIIEHSQ